MKITRVEKREVTEVVLDDIICNQCGGSCKMYMGFAGLIEACVSGGYSSKLGDGNYYDFSICEDCLKVLFAGFKVPVTKTVAGWAACTPEGDIEEDGTLIPIRPDTNVIGE